MLINIFNKIAIFSETMINKIKNKWNKFINTKSNKSLFPVRVQAEMNSFVNTNNT